MYRILAYDTDDIEMMMEHYERLTKDIFKNIKEGANPKEFLDKIKEIAEKK